MYLSQNRKSLIAIENKLMVTKGEREREQIRSLELADTHCYIENKQGPIV